MGSMGGRDAVGTSGSRRAFMRIGEVAELLDLSQNTVERMCREKQIKAVRLRNQWRIPRKPLLRYLGIDEDDL